MVFVNVVKIQYCVNKIIECRLIYFSSFEYIYIFAFSIQDIIHKIRIISSISV